MRPETIITYLSDFLISPIITVFMIILPFAAFFEVKKRSSIFAAILSFILVFLFGLLIFLCDTYISNEIRGKFQLEHRIEPIGFLGFVFTFFAYAAYVNGRKSRRKLGNQNKNRVWAEDLLDTANGSANGIETTLCNFPIKRNKTNGKIRLHENQSYELMDFLETEITPKNYEDIIKSGGASFKVETESAPQYEIAIRISDNYAEEFGRSLNYEAFFSDILDSIADAYKKSKIKP